MAIYFWSEQQICLGTTYRTIHIGYPKRNLRRKNMVCMYFTIMSMIWITCTNMTNMIAVFGTMKPISADHTMVLDQLVQPGSTTTWTSWGLGHLTVLSRCDEVEYVCFSLFFLICFSIVSSMIYISSIIENWFAFGFSITFLVVYVILHCSWFFLFVSDFVLIIFHEQWCPMILGDSSTG